MIRTIALTLITLIVPVSAVANCSLLVPEVPPKGLLVSPDSKIYSDAAQVVLLRNGDHTVLSMSVNYKGPAKNFAMVVPVPVVLQEENIKTLPPYVFERIDQLSAPRLVEYWELPCWRPSSTPDSMPRFLSPGSSKPPAPKFKALGVTIEAKFSVDEYQIVILSAKEANGLETWLRQHQYAIPDGVTEALAPYIRSGMKFFVAKVDVTKVKKDANGVVFLSPLRFDYPSAELRLPVRLGLVNANGKQDLLIYILSDSRFEAANYPNVFIPTNLNVEESIRTRFGEFYAALFDATMDEYDDKAVITEYAWKSYHCDPCPAPPLTHEDLALFGADLFRQRPQAWTLTRLHTRYSKETLSEDLVFTQAKPVKGGSEEDFSVDFNHSPQGGEWRAAYEYNQMVSQALHLKRDLLKDKLSQSLVKPKTDKQKKALMEKRRKEQLELERERRLREEKLLHRQREELSWRSDIAYSKENLFQGRYTIRHYWKGKAHCSHPRWNQWGGPPSGTTKIITKQRTSSPSRDAIDLDDVVRTKVPLLSISGKSPPTHE